MNKAFLLFISILGFVSCSSEKEYDATGVFESTEVTVSAETGGRIISFEAKEGDKLEKGDEVAIIDTAQLYLKKLQLMANAKSVVSQRPDINKQIAVTREQIAKAEKERDRVAKLVEANAAGTKQLDDWNSQLNILNRQLEAQLSSLSNTESSLNEQSSSLDIQRAQIEDLLDKSYVKSPISGLVLSKYAEEGEYAVQGKPLFKIADMDDVFIRAYITSEQLAKVNIGTKAKVYASYGNETRKEFDGEVIWISGEAEFTPKNIITDDERANLVYAVKIAVNNDGSIKLGMFGEVKFIKD